MENSGNKIFEPIFKFTQPFTEKYTLTIASDIKAGSVKFESIAQIRWMVNVKKILNDSVCLEVITLDNKLLKSNNPLIEELAITSHVFSTMYKEVELEIDEQGKILNILNIDAIKNRWQEIKEQMLKQTELSDINNLIKINEKVIDSPEIVKSLIENNEFFQIYMHHFYGQILPFKSSSFKKKNLLNTREVFWKYQYDIPQKKHYKDYISNNLDVKMDGKILAPLDESWNRETYKDFTHIDPSKVKPEFSEFGSYKLDLSCGKLLFAELTKKEIVDKNLIYANIHYKLESDTYKNEMGEISKEINIETKEPFKVRKFSFIEE